MSNHILITAAPRLQDPAAKVTGQTARFSADTAAGETLHIQASAHTHYQLTDAETGLAPENLMFERVGSHLHIRDKSSASSRPDIIIENYYAQTDTRISGLQADGIQTAYGELPAPSTLSAEQVTVHQTGQGGGINKLALTLGGLAGAGLLGALAGGGGGGGGGSSSQPPAGNASSPTVKIPAPAEKTPAVPAPANAAQNTRKPQSSENNAASKPEAAKEAAAGDKNTPANKAAANSGAHSLHDQTAAGKPSENKNGAVSADENSGKSDKPATKPADNSAQVSDGQTDKPATSGKQPASNQNATPATKPADEPVAPKQDATKPAENKPAQPPVETKPADNSAQVSDGQANPKNDYRVYEHPQYGKYIDASEFGTDPSGKTDSLAAINAALAAAHKENAAVYLSGNLYISNQIVLNKTNSGVTGLFGGGMGKTTVSFDKAQTGVFNSDTNEDDIRAFAGILVDGQNGKTIADLSVKYTNPDFYRTGKSYFGKVNGILVNDADNTLISKVEVSGANRAGVFFTSTQTLQKDPASSLGRTYKARLIRGEVDETYEPLPVGENNRIIDSNLHHNRVAGVLLAYQKNFTAEGNTMSWNGHEADGGTGYGIASMAGSYNYGVAFKNNTTDHNYRKGLDVHDGDNIVIEGNTSIGDRLYGIAVYNRQFTMDKVKISNNTIIADPDFRLAQDDDLAGRYHGYSGIHMQTNTQLRDLRSSDTGHFEISGNIIKNLDVYKNALQTYGIEFRNHEPKMHYTLDITNNTVEGTSTKYAVAVINNTKNKTMDTNGLGSGTINITGNKIDIARIPKGTLPVFIAEESNNGQLRGKVTFSGNSLTIREQSDGTIEGVQMVGNAESYHVTGNTFEIHGLMDKPIVSLIGRAGSAIPKLYVSDNDITSDLTGALYRSWIERNTVVDVYADNNTHNGKELAEVRFTVSQPSAGTAPETAEAAHVLDLGIGSDTVSDTSNTTHGNTLSTGKPQLAKTLPAAAATGAEAEKEDSDGLPVLSDVLAANELDLSGILGAEARVGFAGGIDTAAYTASPDIREEPWQETAAFIV